MIESLIEEVKNLRSKVEALEAQMQPKISIPFVRTDDYIKTGSPTGQVTTYTDNSPGYYTAVYPVTWGVKS